MHNRVQCCNSKKKNFPSIVDDDFANKNCTEKKSFLQLCTNLHLTNVELHCRIVVGFQKD